MDLEQLKFPIGNFVKPQEITEHQITTWIDEIAALPQQLIETVSTISKEKLNTPYRPGGWTLKQVVHHIADSHMNSYIRFKLACTEDNPSIRPYFEDRWAELNDAKFADVQVSLSLISALHGRWVLFLKSMKSEDWEKTFFHPESKKTTQLKEVVGIYAWHGKHHLNHLKLVK